MDENEKYYNMDPSQWKNAEPQGQRPNMNNSNYDQSNEPGYSPYSSQPSYNSTVYTTPQGNKNPDGKKNGGKKTGRIILAVLISVAIIISGLFVAFIVKNPNALQGKKNDEQQENNAEVQISDSIAEVDESDGLSSQEIYSKNIKSNVGIILYGSSTSFFSSGNSNNGSSVAGEGSGIVIPVSNGDNSKTYIATCAHVIEPAKTKGYKVVVQDWQGEQYDAVVVGYDSKTDVGVISVEGTNFTKATLGDSSKLKIGETVYAIGNPGGTEFFGSYTKGMISAIDRPVSNEIGYDMKSIQHDAAINPGNSGGMLLNSSGQVVGINSSKIASTEYEGMGFSIPITSAKPIIEELIKNGYVTNRPKLGITYSPVSSYPAYAMIAHYNDLPAGTLIIVDIGEGSAFKGTDVKKGDLITAVNGKAMETSDVLLEKIENGKVGDKLKLTICRINEKTYDVKKFDVEISLVEDKGSSTASTEEDESYSYEDFFNEFFGGGF